MNMSKPQMPRWWVSL